MAIYNAKSASVNAGCWCSSCVQPVGLMVSLKNWSHFVVCVRRADDPNRTYYRYQVPRYLGTIIVLIDLRKCRPFEYFY